MAEAKKNNRKEKKVEEIPPELADDILNKFEELEGAESNGMTNQEEILQKMKENPVGTLAVGLAIGATLVYYFTKKKQAQQAWDPDMT